MINKILNFLMITSTILAFIYTGYLGMEKIEEILMQNCGTDLQCEFIWGVR